MLPSRHIRTLATSSHVSILFLLFCVSALPFPLRSTQDSSTAVFMRRSGKLPASVARSTCAVDVLTVMLSAPGSTDYALEHHWKQRFAMICSSLPMSHLTLDLLFQLRALVRHVLFVDPNTLHQGCDSLVPSIEVLPMALPLGRGLLV